jgi:hypothetical protein
MQYLMPATVCAPRPVACTSRSRPPVPVSAPGKGATPEGKLCVSAVKMGCKVSGAATMADGAPAVAGASL